MAWNNFLPGEGPTRKDWRISQWSWILRRLCLNAHPRKIVCEKQNGSGRTEIRDDRSQAIAAIHAWKTRFSVLSCVVIAVYARFPISTLLVEIIDANKHWSPPPPWQTVKNTKNIEYRPRYKRCPTTQPITRGINSKQKHVANFDQGSCHVVKPVKRSTQTVGKTHDKTALPASATTQKHKYSQLCLQTKLEMRLGAVSAQYRTSQASISTEQRTSSIAT